MSGSVTTVNTGVAGKCKKRDRNKRKCDKYRLEERRSKSKLRHLLIHLRDYDPNANDLCAQGALARLKGELSIIHQKPVYERLGMQI